MQISKRLKTVASLVTEGYRVADIGTDHAYVPIFLVTEGLTEWALAMDIGRGPLERASEHIKERGLQDKIETRLSDGLSAYRQGEADSIVIAGMGGALMVRILTDGADKCTGLKELILSPQSEIFLVRRFLVQHGWSIEREIMLEEDGKYYTVMRAVPGESSPMKAAEEIYGRYLLEHRHPVLYEYLLKEKETILRILASLQPERGEHIMIRKKELTDKLALTEEALSYYEVQRYSDFSG